VWFMLVLATVEHRPTIIGKTTRLGNAREKCGRL
jgi:hypothetical protein